MDVPEPPERTLDLLIHEIVGRFHPCGPARHSKRNAEVPGPPSRKVPAGGVNEWHLAQMPMTVLGGLGQYSCPGQRPHRGQHGAVPIASAALPGRGHHDRAGTERGVPAKTAEVGNLRQWQKVVAAGAKRTPTPPLRAPARVATGKTGSSQLRV